MRATWLPEVLRAAGLDVYELPGWQGRGKPLTSIEGVVWHHTASGPNWQDGHVAAMLRDGRPDLAGPLAQLGLERDGTFVVVADGKANHNGYGTWGNQAIGIEAYNDGKGEPWPAAQLDAYDRGTAAILAQLGYGSDRMKGHRETDPKRKPDPTGIDLNAARQRVARLITYRTPEPEDIDMTKAELLAILNDPKGPLGVIRTDLAEVKRQVAKSEDANAKGGRTLRHISESDLRNGD